MKKTNKGESRISDIRLETANQKIEFVTRTFPKLKQLIEVLFTVPPLYTKGIRDELSIQNSDLIPKIELLLDQDALHWVEEQLLNGANHPHTHRYAVIVFDYPNIVSRRWWATKSEHNEPVAWGSLYADFQSILPIVIKLLSRKPREDDIRAFQDHHVNYGSVSGLITFLRNSFSRLGGFAERINNPNQHKAGVYHNVYAFSFESKPNEE